MSGKMTFSKHESWLIAMLFLTMNVLAIAQPITNQPAASQTTTSNVSAATPPPKESSAKPAAVSPSISTGQAIYLVRSTLMMLNDANRSGNYTVLRDLAAPEFQRKNSAADLAESFLDLRRRKFDFFAVSFASPQFSPDPSVDSSGKVRLTGSFPTRPLQIRFDLRIRRRTMEALCNIGCDAGGSKATIGALSVVLVSATQGKAFLQFPPVLRHRRVAMVNARCSSAQRCMAPIPIQVPA